MKQQLENYKMNSKRRLMKPIENNNNSMKLLKK